MAQRSTDPSSSSHAGLARASSAHSSSSHLGAPPRTVTPFLAARAETLSPAALTLAS
eukprot:CAMPEP_0202833322 /NCGR_PEP_ID=MMETSP1389-20130828/24681_1 /ASSEMBLY_ACC=CAM_ASM_000865 /TAXON_ID=302021 /ORGANISM="Rhodomonas sp., Strain CCMP768" /LENGTH=56 /DNA_ID=CAMNT_0049507903 /DNA_START=49 /DNA_END=217 /DNA_ORIENTATION=+